MRVLVTGAGGFIGANVVGQLVEGGHEVIAVDRTEDALSTLARWGDRLSRVALTLGPDDATRALFVERRPQAIIHLAWYADPTDYLTSTHNLTSLAATIAMVTAALGAGCRKLIMTGSCVEYAPSDRILHEGDPADPVTLYASCKLAAWIVCRALARAEGASASWARIFHLHGPGESARRLIPWVASELGAGRAVDLTDGTQVRDHLHVADVASGLVALLSQEASGVYNVCSGEPVSLRNVLEIVGDIVGRPELLRFGARPHRPEERMFLAGDSSRLRHLGWAPRFGLREGLMNALGISRSGYGSGP